jgi:hypothetical protein
MKEAAMREREIDGPMERGQREVRGSVQHRVERLLVVRPQDGADGEAAGLDLEDLPGIVSVAFSTITGSFDVLFDPTVISDDELAAALHHQGYDLVSWQEVISMHADDQRGWLLEQIRSLASHAEHQDAERGTYADGVTRGAVDAYVRTARAFGLVTDAEIVQLLPPRFVERPH